jgi:hypothetical protein
VSGDTTFSEATDPLGDSAVGGVTEALSSAKAASMAVDAGAADGFARLYYYFVVLGPAPGKVTLDITGRIIDTGYVTADFGYTGFVSSAGLFGRAAGSSPNDGRGTSFRCDNRHTPDGCGEHAVSFTLTVGVIGLNQLTPGVLYEAAANMITLQAAADTSEGASATAFVDPLIAIDPSTPNASDYRIYLDNGVGNGIGGVPEPATWAMMLAGLGGVGAVVRGTRRSRALAAC